MNTRRLILTPDQNLELVKKLPIKVHRVSSSKVTAHCCFHEDKTPSMGIDLKRGIYNCFSCKRSGTLPSLAYELVQRGARALLNLDTSEAEELHTLNSIAYAYIEPDTPDVLFKKYADAPAPLVTGKLIPWSKSYELLQYLQQRGVQGAVATAWDFKYAVDITARTLWNPVEPQELQIKRRLAVPVRGPGRKVLSYEFRSIHDWNKPKVLYISPIDYLFRYGALDKNKPVYLTEGLIDAARLFPFISNITYMFGSALSAMKVFLLRQFPSVVMVPDNDAPGYKLVKDLVEAGLNVYVQALPEVYEDAGDRAFTENMITRWLETSRPVLYNRELAQERYEHFLSI